MKKSSKKKNILESENEYDEKSELNKDTVAAAAALEEKAQVDNGFTSDSSSNDLLEKCPICLLTFRQQEIGSPSTCQHIFCANCIEAWSKNVQTCPIDRIEFQRIIVRESYENRRILREINVDPNLINKKSVDTIDLESEDDVTNCEICNRSDREDVMLLCDHCNQGYHMDCLTPSLVEVPEGSWYCDNCVDSQDEDGDDNVEAELNMLYEDIRDMGIPDSLLHVREVHQPRILRTRQNERIRAAVLRRTRANSSQLEMNVATRTSSHSSRRGRSSTTTTTTTTTTRTRRTVTERNQRGTGVSRTRKRRRRRKQGRRRTYVVEYDLNNFDEKFAIKTTKKIIRRRRRKIRSKRKAKAASKSLAEQFGVKKDVKYTSQLSGTAAAFSLFGSRNDLEYFSDSDNGEDIENEIHIDSGPGMAVQTSVRVACNAPYRNRKGLLLRSLMGNQTSRPASFAPTTNNSDILSSIINMQDRWHNASRNLEKVHINPDGTLNLPNALEDRGSTESLAAATEINRTNTPRNGPDANVITEAPLYSRGGGNANFNNSGGGGYNNRYNNSNNSSSSGQNYRGGSAGSGNQYRHSTGGGVGGASGVSNFHMVGRGNFNFSNNPNYNNPNQNQITFSPFPLRFQQRNQQNNQRNNNQQRNSLPFISNRNNERNDATQHQQNNRFVVNIPSNLPPPPIQQLGLQQNMNASNDNSLFAGLPPPVCGPPPGLPPAAAIALPTPVLMSVPPPPAPPPVVASLNFSGGPTSLFQLNSDYGNDDDASNCPNFSVYSQESQEVAKSSENNSVNEAATQAKV